MLQPLKNCYHLLQGILAVNRFGHPGKKLTVIGVTGTDGKTTTSSLIYHILRETGYKVALISTVAAYIGDKKFDTGFHVSTPSNFQLQSYLAKAVHEGIKYLVLEVTSHAIDQYRVYGIPFKIAVLTNISHEHLDYHKTMENYMATKARLLKMAETAIINHDDQSFSFISNQLAGRNTVSYGLDSNADVTPQNHPFKSQLFGKFNTYNTLAALAVCDILGIDQQKAVAAVSTFKPPEGRCEVLYEGEFSVIIDFAHTPNGIRNILGAVADEKKGRLIHVFGSAGERDKKKRPIMGEASGFYSDLIILTTEDPRRESPEKIAEEIKLGIPEGREVEIIPDRQKAIDRAIAIARKGDVVVITGKGHEQSMNFGKGEIPWSDHKAVAEALKLRNVK